MSKNKIILLGLILLIIVSFVSFSVSIGAFYLWNHFNPKYEISFDSKTTDISNIKKFNEVRNYLKDDYYEDVNENLMLEGAIAGMADSLKDPYTVYFTKEQMDSFMEKSEGSYVGIGVSITLDNNGLVSIVEPFEDSPAKNSGILQGDKILKVDDKDITGLKDENMVVSMIKGTEGTKVKLTVYRPSEGKSIDYDIIRKKIKVSNIKSEMLPDNIGYIKLVMFDSDIASYFEQHLKKLQGEGMKGLIIDLRDNPGGAYDQVVTIADRLLPKDLIVYTEDKKHKKAEEWSDSNELSMPVTVLVNGNSASASEILAGALKDNKKGTLVGTKTFGKGLVQEVKRLDDGSGLKVTIAKYFTPSGVCIQGDGINPDIEVKTDEKYNNLPVSQIPREDDVQLKKAVEVTKESIK